MVLVRFYVGWIYCCSALSAEQAYILYRMRALHYNEMLVFSQVFFIMDTLKPKSLQNGPLELQDSGAQGNILAMKGMPSLVYTLFGILILRSISILAWLQQTGKSDISRTYDTRHLNTNSTTANPAIPVPYL